MSDENTMQLIPYSLEMATIEALKTKYMDISINPDDKAAYAMVMSGLRECREIRLDADAWHKDRKEGIVKAGKFYDGERRRVHALVAPIEDHLADVRKKEDDRIKAIEAEKAAKEQARKDAIQEAILSIQRMAERLPRKTEKELTVLFNKVFELEIDERFQEFRGDADRVKTETMNIIMEAIGDREKLEAENAARKKEAERLEKIRKEQKAEADRQAAERKAIEDEKAAIEKEKKAEADRKEREELARKEFERGVVEAKEKIARENKEKEEIAQRQAAEAARLELLRPDKEKLLAYGATLLAVESPKLKDKKAKAILGDVNDGLDHIMTLIKTEVEAL